MEMDMSFDDDEDVLGPSDEEADGVGVVEELVTPSEVLRRIERGWMNEKMAPGLLPPLTAEVEAMQRQLKVMERNLRTLAGMDMRTDIHKLEVERIKFVVVSYIRTRFFKLQRMAQFYFDQEQKRSANRPSILSPQEFGFVRGFVTRLEEHLKATVTSKFPVPLGVRSEEKKRRIETPKMDAHVFFQVKERSVVELEDTDEPQVVLEKGQQLLMRYDPIVQLLFDGVIFLI